MNPTTTAIIKQATNQASKQLIKQAARGFAKDLAVEMAAKAGRSASAWTANRSKQIARRVVNGKAPRRSPANRTRGGNRVDFDATTRWSAIAPVNYATVMQGGARSLRVHQTEIIGKIGANTSGWWNPTVDKYSVFTLPINPANPTTFPWLSYIARLYDKYRFHSLTFRYINSVPTATRGNFMMALDYDTLDEAPSSLIEGSQLAKYQLTPIYVPATFNIPVNHPGSRSWLYTFDLSAVNNTVDLKTYNLGNLFIALDGLDPDGPVDFGYLAVEYDVELIDKNPVVKNFASATFDSGTQPNKLTRSSVDPADTMEVTTELENGDTGATVTFKFSDDVNIGAKVRMLSSLVIGNQESFTYFQPADTSVARNLEQQVTRAGTGSQNHTITTNTDITIPESREVVYNLHVGTPESVQLLNTMLMAYTYA